MRIAIDLGTTNSLVAIRNNGKTELVPNQFGNYLTPSIVYYDKGEVFVGEMAYEKEIIKPQNTFRLFKRSIGSNHEFGDDKLSAIDLTTLLLKQLINNVEVYTHKKVDEAIISVPAYFTDEQRQATKLSGMNCGIKVNRIINEPSAASLAYQKESQTEGFVLVFDFGGGTLDVTVVDLFDNIIDIVSIAGDNHLGGHDLDQVIYEELLRKHPKLYDMNEQERKIIDKKIEEMKINLSLYESAKFNFKQNDYWNVFEMTQLEYIKLSAKVLSKIKIVVSNALKGALINSNELTDVVCVGGSSKSIIIQNYLKELMNRPVNTGLNPETAIIEGLGIMLAIMDRELEYKDMLLTDVCPFTLGIGVMGDVFSPIIPRNTTLPTSKTSSYTTTHNNQTDIIITIYQGESITASKNRELHTVDIKVEKLPQGEAVAFVNFQYDINGVLNIQIDGKHVEEKYNHELITNRYVSEKQIKKSKKLLESLDVQTTTTREDLIIARFERLYLEVSDSVKYKLENLYKEFNQNRCNMGKSEKLLLIKETNRKLDSYENAVIDPFKETSIYN